MNPNYPHVKSKISQSKLASYSAMAGILIANNNMLHSQVVYHDLEPDYFLNYPDDVINIDMNSDGINDFQFVADGFINFGSSGASSSTVQHMNMGGEVIALGGNLVAEASWLGGYSSSYYINELNAGELINDVVQFGNGTHGMFWGYGSYGWSISSGLIPADGDKFIGVKLLIDGDYHFGWIRLATENSGYTYSSYQQIKDFAFAETAGASIIAGDTFDLVSCETPTITSVLTGPTSIKVFWNAVDYAKKYNLWYRVAGGVTWTKLNFGAVTQKKITGLLCNTTYEFKLSARCGADATVLSSAFTAIQTATTYVCKMEGETLAEHTDIWTDGNNLFVNFDQQPLQPAQLTISSLQGQLVYSSELINTENSFPMEIPAGMYLVVVMMNGEKAVNKVIIE